MISSCARKVANRVTANTTKFCSSNKVVGIALKRQRHSLERVDTTIAVGLINHDISSSSIGRVRTIALWLTRRQQQQQAYYHYRSKRYDIPILVGCAGILGTVLTTTTQPIVSSCDAALVTEQSNQLVEDSAPGPLLYRNNDDKLTTRQKLYRYWRMVKRMIKLAITLSPIALFYPVLLLSSKGKSKQDEPTDARDIVNNVMLDETVLSGIKGWYYRLCLACVENSGACVIKLMQWAGSRPDLFGNEFCSIFSRLQDNTRPHSWYHTVKLLETSYGPQWQEQIRIPNKQQSILGSGCIGQVYFGQVRLENGSWQDVAIKILHPNVEEYVEADLDLMRTAVRYLPVAASYRWLNLEGIVEELARLLQLQMDLRYEGRNLVKFHENFRKNDKIKFPKLIDGYTPTRSVLIEEYCTGIPISKFCRDNYHTNRPLLSKLCQYAIEAVCQMIFLDNFVHGDLHPGNVFVSPDGKNFILFDVGIVNEYSDADHQIIVDVLASFIRKDGRKAGRLMIDDSNSKLAAANILDHAKNEEQYIDKIEALTIRASTKGYFMEHLGTYVTYICNAASYHHVMMNPAFISAALAIKVQEGIALAMDPTVQIPNIAIPIIIESERRRIMESSKTKVLSNIQDFLDAIRSFLPQNNNTKR